VWWVKTCCISPLIRSRAMFDRFLFNLVGRGRFSLSCSDTAGTFVGFFLFFWAGGGSLVLFDSLSRFGNEFRLGRIWGPRCSEEGSDFRPQIEKHPLAGPPTL